MIRNILMVLSLIVIGVCTIAFAVFQISRPDDTRMRTAIDYWWLYPPILIAVVVFYATTKES